MFIWVPAHMGILDNESGQTSQTNGQTPKLTFKIRGKGNDGRNEKVRVNRSGIKGQSGVWCKLIRQKLFGQLPKEKKKTDGKNLTDRTL